MPATILNGRETSDRILNDELLKSEVEKLNPQLVIVQVGDNDASNVYIGNKLKACKKIAMRAKHLKFNTDISFENLMKAIRELNEDSDVTGFIIQLPLPEHLKKIETEILDAVHPLKDVDGLSSDNLGLTMHSSTLDHLTPATPAGMIRLLKEYGTDLRGKIAIMIGQGKVVGKPLGAMLIQQGVSPFICHIDTPPNIIKDFSQRYADLIFSAVGKHGIVTPDMVKPGAIVIDAGITRHEGRLVGDVSGYDEILEIAQAITPVPGGVGPMTILELVLNVVKAKKLQSAANNQH